MPSNADLDRFAAAGLVRAHAAMSDALLTRVLDGASITGELPAVCRQVLEDQELI